MELPNNGGDNASTNFYHHLLGIAYIYLNHWTKGLYGHPQTSYTVAKGIGFSSQSDKALLLKITLTYLT